MIDALQKPMLLLLFGEVKENLHHLGGVAVQVAFESVMDRKRPFQTSFSCVSERGRFCAFKIFGCTRAMRTSS